jgi:hypothetical protein
LQPLNQNPKEFGHQSKVSAQGSPPARTRRLPPPSMRAEVSNQVAPSSGLDTMSPPGLHEVECRAGLGVAVIIAAQRIDIGQCGTGIQQWICYRISVRGIIRRALLHVDHGDRRRMNMSSRVICFRLSSCVLLTSIGPTHSRLSTCIQRARCLPLRFRNDATPFD